MSVLEISRVDRENQTYDLPTLFPKLGGSFTVASVALLPPRTGPSAATVWTSVTVASNTAPVLFAGPDADSTGAVVATGNADVWIKTTVGSQTDAVKAGTVRVAGGGSVTPPGPLPQVLSVQGRTGAVVLAAADVGADASGAATAAQAAAIAAIPSMSTIAAAAELRAAFGLVTIIPPSGDTTGATDTAAWQAAINANLGTGHILSPAADAAYYINAPLIVLPTNTGTTNAPQQVPSIFCLGGSGRIGDEPDTIAGTRFIATATFPLGKFLIDYQQNGTPYAGNGARVGGFTLECNNRAAGFRAQGARQFHVSDLSIINPIAPVSPGSDLANGGFSITETSTGGSAAAYNLFERIVVWANLTGNGDCFFDNSNGESTYINCRALAATGGASYHVGHNPAGTIPNNTYLDCHYAGGAYGVHLDYATTATFIGLSLFNNVPWPTKNALLIDDGWQYDQTWQYPPLFTNCRFVNDPPGGTSEADGAVVRFSALATGYAIDATFTACFFGEGNSHTTTDFVYSDAGIVNGSQVTFRDCMFLGTPTVAKVNDQSKIARFFGCKGIADNLTLVGQVNSTSDSAALTSTPSDIPGATLTFTAPTAGTLLVIALFDWNIATSAEMAVGYLNVDGTDRAQAVVQAGGTSREANSRSWAVPLTQGSHTIKMRGASVAGAGNVHTNVTHTGFTYQFVPTS